MTFSISKHLVAAHWAGAQEHSLPSTDRGFHPSACCSLLWTCCDFLVPESMACRIATLFPETGNGCLVTSQIPAPLSSSRLKHDVLLFLCKSQHNVQFLVSLRSHPLLLKQYSTTFQSQAAFPGPGTARVHKGIRNLIHNHFLNPMFLLFLFR